MKLLQPYPFDRLHDLLRDTTAGTDRAALNLSIGEPRHPAPAFIREALEDMLPLLTRYPATRGTEEFRSVVAGWLCQRYSLPVNSMGIANVLPVNGTREALFAITQCMVDHGDSDALVLCPNPFYQIYEGAALLAGARPWYVKQGGADGAFLDLASVPAEVWQRCRLFYVCSPDNPTGAVFDRDFVRNLLQLSSRYGFVIASDECYSEIYIDEENPPPGLLQYASELGNTGYERCIVFHSLSKRSSLPGLRSGFVAGDARLISDFYQYRTYHGSAMSLFTQQLSMAAWRDEEHVIENRKCYRDKLVEVAGILEPVIDIRIPVATFYLWPQTPVDDLEFARGLYRQQNVTVLPGRFISRTCAGENPGSHHVRIALVDSPELCREAAFRIREYIQGI